MSANLTPEQQQLRNNQIAMLRRAANADQKKAIEYFTATCSLFTPKDEVFDQLVAAKRRSINTRQMALNKIGLDEDQLKEIPDVTFEGFQIDTWLNEKIDGFSKIGADMRWRSGKYAITHLFFSSTQVYMYKYAFSTYNNDKIERTEEYFYRDITNFSTASESVNVYNVNCMGNMRVSTADTQRFALVVPSDSFSCETQMNIEQSVQAMKAKLREKKNA